MKRIPKIYIHSKKTPLQSKGRSNQGLNLTRTSHTVSPLAFISATENYATAVRLDNASSYT